MTAVAVTVAAVVVTAFMHVIARDAVVEWFAMQQAVVLLEAATVLIRVDVVALQCAHQCASKM
jgi:hypothetical protein